jgi:hypothetical protein
MALRKKSAYSTKKTNPPLYSLSNDELETLNEKSDDADLRWEIAEILRLRHNIEVLSRSAYADDPSGIIKESEFSRIIFGFESILTSPSLMFLSDYDEMMGTRMSTYPIALYLGISDATTLEEIKASWKEIKYWQNHIHHTQKDKNPEVGEDFLFDLHTKNMAGTGYGGLEKEINQKLEMLLGLEASNKKWIKKFEKELRAYLSKKAAASNIKTSGSPRGHNKEVGTKLSSEPPSSAFSRIRQNFRNSYNLKYKKLWLEQVYKDAPLKCLNSIPKERPDISLEPEALAILSNLGYKREQGEECIKTALQAIAKGRTMKNIVMAKKVRETLRSWRNKYGLPSPGKKGVG